MSPHGRGLDCYRTWEALFCGCIVVAKRSPIDSLYRDLPVALVDDYREITARRLETWLDEFEALPHENVERALSLEVWRARIEGSLAREHARD